jgi:hypothetical protein
MPEPTAGIPDGVIGIVDRECERFKSEWRCRRSPRIEDYLSRDDATGRSALLRELVALEWELRLEAGETP